MSAAGRRSLPERPRAFLHALAASQERIDSRGVMMIVAHPDDETIALGAQLPRLNGIKLVHVTDGAPENMADARSAGFSTRNDYARARRGELEAAMALAGIGRDDLRPLETADQAAARHLPWIARRLAELFREHGIHTVVAHAYEGGHPDHDAVAFGVHAARALISRAGREAPGVLEVPLYRSRNGAFVMQDFAAAGEADLLDTVLDLDEAQFQKKRRMLDAHVTQTRLLASYRHTKEPIRVAPRYDFGQLPNGGEVYYENKEWSLTGAEWLVLVKQACRELGLPSCL